MSLPEPDERVADALGSIARRAAERSEIDDASARAALLVRASRARPTRSARVWFGAVPALALVAMLLVWWKMPAELRYEVVGATENGSYVSAPADRSAEVRFSDETRVEVARGSQLRVEETSRRGARVLLERGSALVHVVHRDQASWTFAAGPFEVLVTGTRFDLNWDPAREIFEVRLLEGSVEVRTPLSSAPVALRAGQVFRSHLKERSMTTLDAATEKNAATDETTSREADFPPTSDPKAASTEGSDSAEPGETRGAGSVSPSPSWRKLVGAGQFDAVLSQVDARGVPDCLKNCSASDLSALADAARYKQRAALAEQSLRALQTRFAGRPEGDSAVFLLGRLQEQRGALGDARTWYERYLRSKPSGSYAAEALDGKMRMTLRLEGAAAAVPIAREYLKRFPKGVHTEAARRIADAPAR